MRGLQGERAAEVIVKPDQGGEERGSGYLVRTGVVLTAAHVVAGAREILVRFEAHRPTQWTARAEVAWSSREIDVALLTLREEAPRRVSPAAFGAVRERDAGLRCSALGFPLFKRRVNANGVYRESFHALGEIALLAGRKERALEFRVQQPERDPDPQRSPWQGMSGSAVWAHGLIIGVITEHHRAEGLDSLTVSRADRWPEKVLDEAGRAALHGADLRLPLRLVAPRWRSPKALIACGAVLLAAATGGWLATRPGQLHLSITGSCTHVGQTLGNRSSGFTPGGRYTDAVIGPDGHTPPNVSTTGTVNDDGSLGWSWTCSTSDQPGTYRVRVTDDATSRRTGWVTFEIRSMKGYTCHFQQRQGLRYAGISHTRDSILRPGSHGEDVAEVQCLLRYLGYPLGSRGVDGQYGQYTAQAVSAVQQRGHAYVDGETGPQTWHLLRTLPAPTAAN
ncbi:hypothetical protein SHL15_7626 [Streptomyces hygroscopicus subsp. limoneus]|nr:hypothetical protein SHL15_7626 [Streptomyces hygroscopicus subsp. limoneus]